MIATHVNWRDAHDLSAGEWLDELPDTIECVISSTGLIVRETGDFVVICHSVADDGMMQGVFAIPKACILTRVDLS